MNIKKACSKFNEWHYPWKFIDSIRESLRNFPEELVLANSIWDEANTESIWLNIQSLSIGVQKTEENLIQKFPNVNQDALKSFVRSASYNWK